LGGWVLLFCWCSAGRAAAGVLLKPAAGTGAAAELAPAAAASPADCIAEKCPATIRGKDRVTCLRDAKKSCAPSTSTGDLVSKDLGEEKTVYIKAVTGTNQYMYNARGGAGKRCDKYWSITGSANSAGSGAAGGDPAGGWGKWKFSKIASLSTPTKPVYKITNVGRVTERCSQQELGPVDAQFCGLAAGTDHAGTMQTWNAANLPDDMKGWTVRAASKDATEVWLRHEGCGTKLQKATTWLYLDTSKTDEGKNAYLTDRATATKFSLVAV